MSTNRISLYNLTASPAVHTVIIIVLSSPSVYLCTVKYTYTSTNWFVSFKWCPLTPRHYRLGNPQIYSTSNFLPVSQFSQFFSFMTNFYIIRYVTCTLYLFLPYSHFGFSLRSMVVKYTQCSPTALLPVFLLHLWGWSSSSDSFL